VDAKAEQQWSVAVIDVPFAAIAGARKIRGEVAADQACGCSNSGRLTAFTGFEKIIRDGCFATRARFVPDVFVAVCRIWAKAQYVSIRPIVARAGPDRPDRQVNQPSTSSSGHGTRTTCLP
jgi:hypothetical protein